MDENDSSFPVRFWFCNLLCFILCMMIIVVLLCFPQCLLLFKSIFFLNLLSAQVSRHKDYFDGHSWASGLWQQGNGKGQESSSEVCAHFTCCVFHLFLVGVLSKSLRIYFYTAAFDHCS